MNLIENLMSVAKEYQKRTGLSLATIGTKAVNNGYFFANIEAGKTCTVKQYERCMAWLEENMPPSD